MGTSGMTFSELLADRNIELELEDDEVVTDIIILTRNVRMSEGQGKSSIGIYPEEHVDAILAIGMISSALQVYEANPWEGVG